MAKNLVIVESPAKKKIIQGFLGDSFVVESSVGHIRDLPKKGGMSIDIDNGFKPINLSEPDADGVVSLIPGDIQFVNERFLDIISKHNLNNDTLGV